LNDDIKIIRLQMAWLCLKLRASENKTAGRRRRKDYAEEMQKEENPSRFRR
jgi:hypothetical protein